MEKAQIEESNQSIEETSIDEDQIIDDYLQQITQENFQQYLKTAKDMKKEQDHREAMYLLRALIEKGTEIYNSELNINLSHIYFLLGDSILQKLEEEQDELFGGEDALEQYRENNGFENFIKEDGHLDKEAFQQSLMENVIKKIQNNELIIQHGQQAEEKRQSMKNKKNEDDEEKEEEDDDLSEIQLAWENIETARVILVKYLDEQTNLKEEDRNNHLRSLSDYIMRLGDIENKKEQFDKALEEYQTSLNILMSIEDIERSRRIAELYFLIGNSYLYAQQDNYLQNALINYEKGENIMKKLISEENDKNKIKELKESLEVFETKVFEVRDEILILESLEKEKERLHQEENEILQKQDKDKLGVFGQSKFNQKPQKLGTFDNKQNQQIKSKNKKISEQIKNQQIV